MHLLVTPLDLPDYMYNTVLCRAASTGAGRDRSNAILYVSFPVFEVSWLVADRVRSERDVNDGKSL